MMSSVIIYKLKIIKICSVITLIRENYKKYIRMILSFLNLCAIIKWKWSKETKYYKKIWMFSQDIVSLISVFVIEKLPS